MKFVNNILCVSVPELESLGIKTKTIRMGCLRFRNNEGESWEHTKVGRKVYIHYESLRQNYQEDIIYDLCGGMDPYDYVASEVLNSELILKKEDSDYIEEFIDGKGSQLSWEYQEDYKNAARYLYLLQRYTNKRDKLKLGFTSVQQFNDAVLAKIKANKIKLPSSWSKLCVKKSTYDRSGASVIISGKHGNNHADKLTEIQKALILYLYSKHNQLSCKQVKKLYNHEAVKQKWNPISESYVNNLINRPEFQASIKAQRNGINTHRNFNDFVVKRNRPTCPNFLWVGDGTPYELYYQKTVIEGRKKLTKYHLRKYIYVVIDAFNDAVMGFAIGDVENEQLITAAWKNACVNQGVLPSQIVTDRFAKKTMAPLYNAIVVKKEMVTPAKAHNARSKVVEQFFGQLNKQVVRRNDNFSGHNITAKNQPNRDVLNKNKKNFPSEARVLQQINDDINTWNNMPREKLDEMSLVEQRNNADQSNNRLLSDKDRLKIFGVKHSHTNRLTNKGLTPTLLGEERVYVELSNEFFKTIGSPYQVYYDPMDLTKILATTKGKEFLLEAFEPLPMALSDFKPGDGERLQRVLSFKKNFEESTIKEIAERNEQVTSLIESEGMLKGWFVQGGTNKNALNDAGNAMKQLDAPNAIDIYDNDELFQDVEPIEPPKKEKKTLEQIMNEQYED